MVIPTNHESTEVGATTEPGVWAQDSGASGNYDHRNEVLS